MTILLDTSRGCVTAPAGTGKTFLLAETVKSYRGGKPLLVLTHTNAGVQVLRKRLDDARVSKKFYVLSTIDGFALHLVRTFPLRAEYSVDINRINYPEMRTAAVRLLEHHHIDAVIRANFSRVLVDEYQDCTTVQHQLICSLTNLLPSCILGDPLQRIFNFKNSCLPTWGTVQEVFSDHHTLSEPMRWIRAGSGDLGHWLLGLRPALIAREPISIDDAPKNRVIHIQKNSVRPSGTPFFDFIPTVSALNGSILIIGSSVKETHRHKLARHFPGASVIEPVDMDCLLEFANRFDSQVSHTSSQQAAALTSLLDFAATLMTGVQSTVLAKRITAISARRNSRPASPVELVALQFANSQTASNALNLLNALRSQKGTRLFRPHAFSLCRSALEMLAAGRAQSLSDATVECRERNRHYTAYLPNIAVGSTLLLKGLEADNVFIQSADDISAENLYVGLTRGSKKVVLRSRSTFITPH